MEEVPKIPRTKSQCVGWASSGQVRCMIRHGVNGAGSWDEREDVKMWLSRDKVWRWPLCHLPNSPLPALQPLSCEKCDPTARLNHVSCHHVEKMVRRGPESRGRIYIFSAVLIRHTTPRARRRRHRSDSLLRRQWNRNRRRCGPRARINRFKRVEERNRPYGHDIISGENTLRSETQINKKIKCYYNFFQQELHKSQLHLFSKA